MESFVKKLPLVLQSPCWIIMSVQMGIWKIQLMATTVREREREQLWQCQHMFSNLSDMIHLLEGQLWLMTLQLQKKKKNALGFQPDFEMSHISYIPTILFCYPSIVIWNESVFKMTSPFREYFISVLRGLLWWLFSHKDRCYCASLTEALRPVILWQTLYQLDYTSICSTCIYAFNLKFMYSSYYFSILQKMLIAWLCFTAHLTWAWSKEVMWL